MWRINGGLIKATDTATSMVKNQYVYTTTWDNNLNTWMTTSSSI